MELFVFLQFLSQPPQCCSNKPRPAPVDHDLQKTHGDGEDQDRRPNL